MIAMQAFSRDMEKRLVIRRNSSRGRGQSSSAFATLLLYLIAVILTTATAFTPSTLPLRASSRLTSRLEISMQQSSLPPNPRALTRRSAAVLIVGTASALLQPLAAKADDFGTPMLVIPAQEKKLPPPKNPYEQFGENLGESYRGKKGPNLQLPDTLSIDDETPAAMQKRDSKAAEPKEDFLDNLGAVDIIASLLWGGALYFGTWFDINTKTNIISSASGDADDVRPSDWLKLKLGMALGMGQETWSDQWKAPPSLQAFVASFFAMLGVGAERLVAVNLGDSFALMSGITAAIWAGVYELGRTQQKGYRLTREEQEALDEFRKDFEEFAKTRIVVKPTARMHMREFTSAFRSAYGKYRTSDQISDAKLEGMFKSYARRVTGMKGKAGYYKGIGVVAVQSAFGGTSTVLRREKESKAQREADRQTAQAAAARAVALAESDSVSASNDGWDEDEDSFNSASSEREVVKMTLDKKGPKEGGQEKKQERSQEV